MTFYTACLNNRIPLAKYPLENKWKKYIYSINEANKLLLLKEVINRISKHQFC